VTSRLDSLAPGGSCRIEEVDAHDALGRRLLDLGLVPGTRVAMIRRAPLGDPLEIEFRGMRLCLRRREAARVRVRPE
jgi:ferrous iron transport protein A